MRSIAIAFSAAVLAAGAALAHGNLSEPAAQQIAGTLTCITRPEASLVFGRTPVADCTFVAERGGFRQSYAAVLTRVGQGREVETAHRITWRVLTKDGFARPGMLSDFFTVPPSQPESAGMRALPEMVGRAASLRLLSHSGQASAKFAHGHPRMVLAAAQSGLSR
ncbi:DUF992 domain-containing protein [Methylobacterium planeticum]|uniref:DUF992 domain-containing protein n=1 Tax=Methylobacterium planeticum TaxID=2615211 RepID=A0A6N6MMQ6_9HYPH|nr:DUF992 domain-containing protein [Methylobacterium planeticum]KAB1071640.1 DUF992 domain-containing protein [Methylobacterium planeticum]